MRSIKWLSDDLGWPLNPQNTPIFAFLVALHIFVVSKVDFVFGVQVDGS